MTPLDPPPSGHTNQPNLFVFDYTGRPCPCCGSEHWRKGPSISPFPGLVDPHPRMVECHVCGTAHLPPLTLPVLLNRKFSVTGCGAEERTHRAKARANVRRLMPYLRRLETPGGLCVLVVGCDVGHEITALLEEPLHIAHIDGVEPIAVAADAARRRFAAEPKVTVHNRLVEELNTGPYDVVMATMVWEHIPDPRAALMHVAERHVDGGFLALQVPRYDNIYPRALRARIWHGIHSDHLWYYTKDGLIALARTCGYSRCVVLNTPRIATPGYALFRIIRAVVRHVYPYFNQRQKQALIAWLRRNQEWLNSHLDLGVILRVDILRDAMTLVAVRNTAAGPAAPLGSPSTERLPRG